MDETGSALTRWHWLGLMLFGVTASMGCLSFNLGNTYEEKSSPTCYVDSSGLLRQRDEAQLGKSPTNDQYTIIYPRPYASKPNLKFLKTSDSVNPKDIEIIEQLPDRFTIRWHGLGSEPIVAWQAEGLPTNSVVVPVVPEGKTITPAKGEQ